LPSANAIVAHLTPVARRGAVFGFTASATSAGGFIGPLTGAGIAALVDIRWVFIVNGVLMLSVAFWIIHALRAGFPAPADAEAVSAG